MKREEEEEKIVMKTENHNSLDQIPKENNIPVLCLPQAKRNEKEGPRLKYHGRHRKKGISLQPTVRKRRRGSK